MRVRAKVAVWAIAAPFLALLWGGCPTDTDSKGDDSTRSPRVDGVTPNRGPVAGGTRVTIVGGPFESQIGVLFGAHAAVDPVVVNAHMITATSPPQGPGVVDVTVLSDGGQTTVLGAFTYDQSQVDIISISPAQGVIAGGTPVTITGKNFSPDTQVKFGGDIARSIVVLSSQLISAVTPPHTEGWVRVQVLSDGTEDSLDPILDPQNPTDHRVGFLYVIPAVQVSSIEPASGPIEGGTQVTIRGSFIPGNVGVLFGDTSATEITFINDQLIRVTTPPGVEGPVDITLVYDDGQVVVEDAFRYTIDEPVIDDGTDTDGDGLSDVAEQTGWETWIESFGLQLGTDTFGNVNRYTVTSDPTLADTDGDGLSDYLEMLIKSDPRKADSDADGLQDGEEWNQWLTSPTSVDTDADARGDRNLQNAPNQALFDGMELFDAAVLRLPQGDPLRIVRARATSPTLFDTDGDGVSDYDEYDSTVRNGVLADLPRLTYELVGDVDVRLNVEYAESIGESHEYGTTLTETQTETVASEFSSTFGWSLDVAVNAGYAEGSAYGGVEVTAGIHGEYTWTSSTESSHEASKEKSRLESDSREFTESSADGAIRTAILLSNPGNTTFTLTDLGVLVSQREMLKTPGDLTIKRPQKTIATMAPVFDTITLAPGETAGPFELAATGVNAQAIKELLTAPDSLQLGTASMNFTDSTGLDFDYVRQFTVAQTASIIIDFGDGEVRTYHVATNVDRNPDSTYRGITLRRAMEEVLRLPYGDPIHGYTTRTSPSGRQRLDSLLGRQYYEFPAGSPRNVWIRISSNPDAVDVDFNDVVLRAGDGVALFFSRDDDSDALSNTLEKAAGTDQDPILPFDADADILTDQFETTIGWIAFENPANPDAPHPEGLAKRRVFSSPTSIDSDGDGLIDFVEHFLRSDPQDPDSDGDSLPDGEDPFPIRPAGIRYVMAAAPSGGNGRTWLTAYTTMQQALADAAAGQATPNVPEDDVSQIWVAGGVYKPLARNTPITLLNNVGIYGGFSGPDATTAGETKRGQRNTNPFTNGCVISGDLNGNDIGTIDLNNPGTYIDNCPVIVLTNASATSSTVLDGFMVTGSYARPGDTISGALRVSGSPTIQNCLFLRNASTLGGAGIVTAPGSSAKFKRCISAGNVASRGGGAQVHTPNFVVFEDCEFSQNEARRLGNDDEHYYGGGGVEVYQGTRVDFNRCAFTGNSAWTQGGGIYATGNALYVRVDTCRFNSNAILNNGGLHDWRGCGGGFALDANASISNSTFWDNRSRQIGGAISVISGSGLPGEGWWNGQVRRCTITNCTITNNRAWITGGNSSGGGVGTGGRKSNVLIQNSVIWNNWYGPDALPDDPPYEEHYQVYDWNWGESNTVVNTSCLNTGHPWRYRAINGNISDDPSLNSIELGDLRLGNESPCIDRGSTFVDLDPLLPGVQALPQFDLFGKPRIADGNADGIVAVDIGAFEVTRPTN